MGYVPDRIPLWKFVPPEELHFWREGPGLSWQLTLEGEIDKMDKLTARIESALWECRAFFEARDRGESYQWDEGHSSSDFDPRRYFVEL